MTGLAIETALLFPLALAWLAWRAASGARRSAPAPVDATLLVLAGIVSTTPLLLFTAAARTPAPIRPSACSSSSPRRCSS